MLGAIPVQFAGKVTAQAVPINQDLSDLASAIDCYTVRRPGCCQSALKRILMTLASNSRLTHLLFVAFTALSFLVAPPSRAEDKLLRVGTLKLIHGITPYFYEKFAPPGYRIEVNLERQTVIKADGETLSFDIDPFRKYCLLNGLDDIGLTLRHAEKIRAFEERRKAEQPWLFR